MLCSFIPSFARPIGVSNCGFDSITFGFALRHLKAATVQFEDFTWIRISIVPLWRGWLVVPHPPCHPDHLTPRSAQKRLWKVDKFDFFIGRNISNSIQINRINIYHHTKARDSVGTSTFIDTSHHRSEERVKFQKRTVWLFQCPRAPKRRREQDQQNCPDDGSAGNPKVCCGGRKPDRLHPDVFHHVLAIMVTLNTWGLT